MSILQEILKYKKEELKTTKTRVPLSELKAQASDAGVVRSFQNAIRREGNSAIKLIAEVKKASPSKGMIREDFNLPKIISVYDKKDVAAISVLTEERFFQGKLDYLKEARKRTSKPLLRKDFIIDDYQVYEARVNGADAILLIAAALEKQQLIDLMSLAKELSLDSLVEVHDHKELDTALFCSAEIIGINNRNLKTLEINLKTTFDLIKGIPDDKIVVSESGINTRADVEAAESVGADAILVGTAIMKADDIGAKIDELTGHNNKERR
ncbi:MAG: indole-3-glycerol phosphate synthase TrpC [Nitrospirae bacterium]|nr:indole-3-glycerol phosphate synthase TrpC [Nitrospirota bacterium]